MHGAKWPRGILGRGNSHLSKWVALADIFFLWITQWQNIVLKPPSILLWHFEFLCECYRFKSLYCGSLQQSMQIETKNTLQGKTFSGFLLVVDCGTLTIPNANLTIPTYKTTYNSLVPFSCNTGYSTTGNSTAICTAQGIWSYTPCTGKQWSENMSTKNNWLRLYCW